MRDIAEKRNRITSISRILKGNFAKKDGRV